MFATFASGLLLHYLDNWHIVFYFFGAMTLITTVLFGFLTSDNPTGHPFISVEEKEFLQKEIEHVEHTIDRAPTPWRSILTSVPVWVLVVASVSNQFFSIDISPFIQSFSSGLQQLGILRLVY